MKILTLAQYDRKPSDYKHITRDGKRSYLALVNGSTALLIEGIDFIIRG